MYKLFTQLIAFLRISNNH